MKKFTVSTEVLGLNVLSLFLPFSFTSFLSSPALFPTRFLFFTLKYAKYLEGFSIDGVRHVYKKACTIHLPKKPAIHLLWAAFEEQQGVHLSKPALKLTDFKRVGLNVSGLRENWMRSA